MIEAAYANPKANFQYPLLLQHRETGEVIISPDPRCGTVLRSLDITKIGKVTWIKDVDAYRQLSGGITLRNAPEEE